MLKRFCSYYKPEMKWFTLDLVCAFFISICGMAYPIVTRKMLNDYIPNSNMRALVIAACLVIVIYIIKNILNWLVTYYGHMVGVHMQANMRKELFEHLQKMPFSYFDEHETGTIMSRMVNDLMNISELAHHGPEDLFISSVMIIGSFTYLCSINVTLTLIIFCFVPVLIIFSMKLRKEMNVAFLESKEAIGEVNANLQSSLSGIRVAKAFTNSKYEEEKFDEGNSHFIEARRKSYKAMATFGTGNGFITDCLNIAVLLFGGIFTYKQIINYADLVTYMLFINQFISPIRTLVGFIEQYQDGMTGFQRFIEILDEPVESDPVDGIKLENVKGEIEFKNIDFSYGEGKETISDISLRINAGETLALVGPSGGGKTTLCHLLPHFYEISKGSIMIDGHDINDITLDTLRRNIGIVQQDVFLFNGTIKENIAYGRLDATDEEIYEAAKRANIHDYVMGLKDGYDTNIGERGIKLSGGQKQRLSIARVFLKNPSILILDEATSALDNTTEILIQKALNELCKGRTTIVVAHRLSTIKNADEIAVISRGKVVEQGTHEALLEKNGAYKTLYDAQFKTVNDVMVEVEIG
ncbi:MAG: ABC transporter ATP-binding protein [Erysipelotrichales bacterium]|nr:ABC transporter ATP-binding protein [Erysipelotrichales bacterium]